MIVSEAEVEKLRERLNKYMQDPVDDRAKEQLEHLREELSARVTEVSRQKAAVSDIQHICDELRDENRRLSNEVEKLKNQPAVEKVVTVSSESAEHNTRISSLQQEVARLSSSRHEVETLEAALNRSKADNSTLRSEVRTAEDRFALAEKDLTRVRRELVR